MSKAYLHEDDVGIKTSIQLLQLIKEHWKMNNDNNTDVDNMTPAGFESFASQVLSYECNDKNDELPYSFPMILLDPFHSSTDKFIKFLEDYVFDKVHDHFLHSLSIGAYKYNTSVLLSFLKSYRYFSKHFCAYVQSLENLLINDNQIDLANVIAGNLDEENGNYDKESLQKMNELYGITSDMVIGIKHPDLFLRCLNALEQEVDNNNNNSDFDKFDDDEHMMISHELVSCFNESCLDKETATFSTALSALYFGSELIVPTMYSYLLHAITNYTSLNIRDSSFFFIHTEIDQTHAAQMREVVKFYANKYENRLEMLKTVYKVMNARHKLYSNLIHCISRKKEEKSQQQQLSASSSSLQQNNLKLSSTILYNNQSSNWVRTAATCLSDFTGRPVVFNMCEDHINQAYVLDVGCGEGYCTRKLMSMGAKYAVGVDISDAMIRKAQEANLQDDSENTIIDDKNVKIDTISPKFIFGNATNLVNTLRSNPAELGIVPNIEFETGYFSLAVAVFVFNYVTISEMNSITEQVHQSLHDDGIFIFSVPHPFMLFTHKNNENNNSNNNKSSFQFNAGNDNLLAQGKYFSLRDFGFSGIIRTIDNRELNVRMLFKTLNDYMLMLKRIGFDIIEIREAAVTSEHMQHNQLFFESVKDLPLHLVFKVKKTVQINIKYNNSSSLLIPKKLYWNGLMKKNFNQCITLHVDETTKHQLLSIANQLHLTIGTSYEKVTYDNIVKINTNLDLSLLKKLGQQIRSNLFNGIGVVSIKNVFKMNELKEDEMKLAYYVLCSFIGQVNCTARGALFDVRDYKLSAKDENVLFSVTNEKVDWHTDGASKQKSYDIMGLLCITPSNSKVSVEGIHPDINGNDGALKLTNGVNAFESLKLKLPDFLMYELLRNIPRDILENGSGKGINDSKKYEDKSISRLPNILEKRILLNSYPICIESNNRSNLKIRYMRYWIETGHKRANRPISPLLKVALDLFDQELDNNCCYNQCMQSGEIIFVNNLQILHARNAFDSDDSLPSRHKVRVWIQAHNIDKP